MDVTIETQGTKPECQHKRVTPWRDATVEVSGKSCVDCGYQKVTVQRTVPGVDMEYVRRWQSEPSTRIFVEAEELADKSIAGLIPPGFENNRELQHLQVE